MTELRWQCPEDHTVVIGLDPAGAEDGVRTHFEKRVHEHLVLAGFTDGGPAIQGSMPEGLFPPSFHVHGTCPTCLASRASNSDMCPRCGTLLENREDYPPHPPIESAEAG